jgi:hypothetical protein
MHGDGSLASLLLTWRHFDTDKRIYTREAKNQMVFSFFFNKNPKYLMICHVEEKIPQK